MWLKSQCGGCVDNHPWWTHREWHHAYHHLPPANCEDVHPSLSHDEFNHKGVSCGDFHTSLDHEDWSSGNLDQPAEETEKEHDGQACTSYHEGETHSDWDDSKEHPGNTCDEEHSWESHLEWLDEKEHPENTCDEEHCGEDHFQWAYQQSLTPWELQARERGQKELVRHNEELRKERDEKETYQFILVLIAIAVIGAIINALNPPLKFF
jgi:hypothetical protein